jgi:hypothetical protein
MLNIGDITENGGFRHLDGKEKAPDFSGAFVLHRTMLEFLLARETIELSL